jgi:hypothetical protein
MDRRPRQYDVMSDSTPIVMGLSVKEELVKHTNQYGSTSSNPVLTEDSMTTLVNKLRDADTVGISLADVDIRINNPLYMQELWKKGVVLTSGPPSYAWAEGLIWFTYSKLEADNALKDVRYHEKRAQTALKRKATYQKRKEAGKILLKTKYPRVRTLKACNRTASVEYRSMMAKNGIGKCEYVNSRHMYNRDKQEYENLDYKASFTVAINLMLPDLGVGRSNMFVPNACAVMTIATTMCLLKNDRYWFVNTDTGKALIEESVAAFKIWEDKGPIKNDTRAKLAFYEGPYMKWIRKQKRLIPKARKAALEAKEEKQRLRLFRAANKARKAALDNC